MNLFSIQDDFKLKAEESKVAEAKIFQLPLSKWPRGLRHLIDSEFVPEDLGSNPLIRAFV